MEKIVTLTVNPALDIFTTTERFESGKKLKCEEPLIDPGGGGVNVSRVIQRLGGDTKAIYTRGGCPGIMFSELLEKENISQDPVDIENNTRQNFAVFESSTGKLYRFGMPGAELNDAECNQVLSRLDQLSQAGFLVASGSLPPGAPDDFYVQVARKAKKKGLKLIVDTSGNALSAILKEGAFLLKPSMSELQDLSGQRADSQQEQKKILLRLLEQYDVHAIVLSLGADGAMLASENTVEHFPTLRVESKSAIGAGDSMVGGIVYSLSQGRTLKEALLYGLACGSATLKSPGTRLLKKKDADELYHQLMSMRTEGRA